MNEQRLDTIDKRLNQHSDQINITREFMAASNEKLKVLDEVKCDVKIISAAVIRIEENFKNAQEDIKMNIDNIKSNKESITVTEKTDIRQDSKIKSIKEFIGKWGTPISIISAVAYFIISYFK